MANTTYSKLHKTTRQNETNEKKTLGVGIILQEKTRELQERVKELDCLYSISRLIEKPRITIPEILQGAVNALPRACQYPRIASARIVFHSLTVTSKSFRETPWIQSKSLKVQGNTVGRVDVAYLEKVPASDEVPFLQEERNLLDQVTKRLGRVIERMRAEEELRDREKDLAMMNQELQEVNTALRVLLRKREEDRAELEKTKEEDKKELEKIVLSTVKVLIQPNLKMIKMDRLTERQKACIDMIESNLRDIISRFSNAPFPDFWNLTPSELNVASLIKQGKKTKDIADLLNLSCRSVEFHRNNIRKKLRLKDKKVNLTTYLLSVP